MKAKHHRRKGRTLMFPDRPPGPQNPWIDPPVRRPTLRHLGPDTGLKPNPVRWAVESAIDELSGRRDLRMQAWLVGRGILVGASPPGGVSR
jgi:hypothetical protein